MGGKYAPQPPIAFCPHCGNKAPQEVVATYNAQDQDTLEVTEYYLTSCATCRRALLYQSEPAKVSPRHMFAPGSSDLKDMRLVWPDPGTMHSQSNWWIFSR